MTKRLRVIAIVVFILIVFTGTASALEFTPGMKQKTIHVYDEDTITTYPTIVDTVQEFLIDNDIELSEFDSMDKNPTDTLDYQDSIKILRSNSVIITLDGVPRMVNTTEKTVGELFNSLNDYSHLNYTMDNVSNETLISNNLTINLTSTIEKLVKKTESIPFDTITRENPDLEYGIERAVQEGSEGELEITTKEVYQSDKLISSVEVERKVTKEPVKTIIEIGTSRKLTTTVGNFKYEKALNVTATGYTPYDPGCNGVTATGTKAKFGVIAVDPRVVPLGTKVYVPGYGVAVAEDTGGAIKGNKIDLCYETKNEAYKWGVRNITIYILE